MKKKPICSICKKKIQPDANGWDGTNNAQPVNDGLCCHSCDRTVVFPARLTQYYTDELQSKEMTDE